MRNFKLLSFILILAVVFPLISGCSLIGTNASATMVYDKYNDIFESYYEPNYLTQTGENGESLRYKNLFNAEKKFYLEYRGGEISNAIINDINGFGVLDTYYKELLNASMSMFYMYREVLELKPGDWNNRYTSDMYDELVALENALSEFESAKMSLENLNSVDNGLLTQDALNNYISNYENVIEKTINFSYLFENAYLQDIYSYTYDESESTVPGGEIKRLAHSAQLHLARSVYYYNIKLLGGFNNSDGYTELIDNLTALNSIVETIETHEAWELENAGLTPQDELQLISFYYEVLDKETDAKTQETLLTRTAEEILKLNGKTDAESLALITQYDNSLGIFLSTIKTYSLYIYDLVDMID